MKLRIERQISTFRNSKIVIGAKKCNHPPFLANYVGQTDQSADQQTNRPGYTEVTLQLITLILSTK